MIYLMRHGQTAGNKARILQGRAEIPLNETGRNQAENAGKWFREQGIRFDLVFSSPLGRARETAAIAAPEVPVRIDGRLIEMHYGPYEGMSLENPRPEVLAFFKDFAHNPEPEGMEPLEEIVGRAGAFLEEIFPLAQEKTLLIATHAIAMKGALEYLTPGSDGAYWSKFVANCAVFRVEVTPEGYGMPEQVM